MARFLILIIFGNNYATTLNVSIFPDTIFVGTLTTISIAITDYKQDEYPSFNNISDNPDNYTVVERILGDYSVDYILQFWEAGLITIPSIPVIIKRNNKNISKLESNIINVSVLTNVKNSNTLRPMKPMQAVKGLSSLSILVYTLIFVIGIILCIYLWKNQKYYNYRKHNRGKYLKSIFHQTIRNLKSLQLPRNINAKSTEEYYLAMSHICRTFVKEEYFIRATEMTTRELKLYFEMVGINKDLIRHWCKLNKIVDLAKYARQMPPKEQFQRDKEIYIDIIKLLHKANPTSHE